MASASKSITEKQEVGTQLDTEAEGEGDSFTRPETAPLAVKRVITAGGAPTQRFTVQIRDRFGTPIEPARKDSKDAKTETEGKGGQRTQMKPSQSEVHFSTILSNRPKTSQAPLRQSASVIQPPQLSFHRSTVSDVPIALQSVAREESEAKSVMDSLHKRFAQGSLSRPRAGPRPEAQPTSRDNDCEALKTWCGAAHTGAEPHRGNHTAIPHPRTVIKRWTSAEWVSSSSQALITQPVLLVRGLSFSTSHSKAATPMIGSPLLSPSGAQLSIPTLLSTHDRLSDSSRLRPLLSYSRSHDWVSIGAHPVTVKDISTGQSPPNFILKTDSEKPRQRPKTVLLRSEMRKEATICSGVFRGTKLLSTKHPGVAFLKAQKARPSPNHFLASRPAVSSRARPKNSTEPPSNTIIDLLIN